MTADGAPGDEPKPRTLLPAESSVDLSETDGPVKPAGLTSLDELMGAPDARDQPDAVAVPAQSERLPAGRNERPLAAQEDSPTVMSRRGQERANGAGRRGGWFAVPFQARRRPAGDGRGGDEDAQPAGAQHPPAPPARPAVGGRVVRGAGELLITAGMVVVLFMVYQLWITDIFASRTQARIRDDLANSWSHQTIPRPSTAPERQPSIPPVEIGDGIAVLRVPRLGADYAPVVVEGVTTEALRRGPGHFPGSALPGEIGNFVLSGHRTTYGKPFSRVDELKVGDPIVVEVADRYFTYRVTGSEIVDPHRLDVTYPVPGRVGEKPTRAVMTLTTCHPRFSAKSRLIVYAELDEARDKSEGPPPVLTDQRGE